jgi:hypothetical protein
LLAALAALAVARCDSGPSAVPDVALGEEFVLAAGQSASAGPDALTVQFERVVEDSRCPSDARCIQAGQVVSAIVVSGSRAYVKPGDSVPSGRYRARLLGVLPYPSSASAIDPAQYRARFVVVRG